EAARLEQKAQTQLSSLGLGELSLAQASGLPMIAEETVDRFAREFASLDREDESLAKQLADNEAHAAKLARDIEALELERTLPTESDLALARERRDARFEDVRHATGAKVKGRADVLAAYEKEVRSADEIADRLRREAERVGKLAALLAERSACSERVTSL